MEKLIMASAKASECKAQESSCNVIIISWKPSIHNVKITMCHLVIGFPGKYICKRESRATTKLKIQCKGMLCDGRSFNKPLAVKSVLQPRSMVIESITRYVHKHESTIIFMDMGKAIALNIWASHIERHRSQEIVPVVKYLVANKSELKITMTFSHN